MLRERQVELVVIDPTYLSMGKVDDNCASQVGGMLRNLNMTCMDAGAQMILCKHYVKAKDEKSPATLKDLSGGGWGAFFRQWVLLNRRKPYQIGSWEHDMYLSIGGSAGHSSIWGIDATLMQCQDPWFWSPRVLPFSEVKGSQKASTKEKKIEDLKEKVVNAMKLNGWIAPNGGEQNPDCQRSRY